MTDIKKSAKDKAPAKRKKLQLNKQTLRDVSATDKAKDVRGGAVKGGARGTPNTEWGGCSDRRIKAGIRPLANALTTIDRLRPVAFRYTDEYRRDRPSIEEVEYYNVIAQEYREVFPQAVKGSGERLADGSEILQVDTYPAMIHAIAAIQELHGKVTVLAQENAALRRQLIAFKKRLFAGENTVATQGVGSLVPESA